MTFEKQQLSNSLPADSSKVYFPGLNALRFFAASFVVIAHVEDMKKYYGFKVFHVTENLPQLAVTFFFVLSGFLITYLLLKEKAEFSTIEVKKFYMRRILRIWPLYYLVVLLSFLIFPYLFFIFKYTPDFFADFSKNFTLHMLFLPNISRALELSNVYAIPLWSIGVEEQFYLIWPLLVKKSRNVFISLIAIIVLILLIRNGGAYFAKQIQWDGIAYAGDFINRFFYNARFSCMAIGGAGAYILYNYRSKIEKIILNRYMEMLIFITLILGIYNDIYFPYMHHEFYSFLFIILILNISSAKKSLLRLESSLWTYFGNISYAIYMLHILVILMAIKLWGLFSHMPESISENIPFHIFVLLLTTFFASLSYHFFESYFLRFKAYFSKISSGTL
jgi:peptidoglycan/LPS O-acetylase OafA/YrhL